MTVAADGVTGDERRSHAAAERAGVAGVPQVPVRRRGGTQVVRSGGRLEAPGRRGGWSGTGAWGQSVLLCLAVLSLAGCASRIPVQLRATSPASPLRVQGEVRGRVSMDGDVLSLQLDSASVQYLGLSPADSTPLEAVTIRAVVASDSAGRGIPQGVSGALQVADVLRTGERRSLTGETMAVPLPPGMRLRDLWLAFQVRGTARPDGREPELVIAYLCSEANVLGATKRAKVRARRMRAGDAAACQL